MAFSLMYSLNARSFKERYQNSVQQNIIKDNERHLLKIFDTLSLQRSLKKKCVSPSNDATGDGGRCEAEAGEDIIVDQRKSYEVEIHTNLKRKTPSISWDCSGRWKGSGSTQSGGLRECRIAGGRRRQERGESEAHQRVSDDDDTEETIEELSGREAELGDADKNN